MSKKNQEEETTEVVTEEVVTEEVTPEEVTPEVPEDETTVEDHPVDEAYSEDPEIKIPEGYAESLEKGYIGDQEKDNVDG